MVKISLLQLKLLKSYSCKDTIFVKETKLGTQNGEMVLWAVKAPEIWDANEMKWKEWTKINAKNDIRKPGMVTKF